MSVNILIKRSDTASKRPDPNALFDGELALNFDAATGGLYYKDTDDNIVKVGPCQVSATAPNSSPAGSTGNSVGEFWFNSTTNGLFVWNGTIWVDTTLGVAVQSVSGTSPIAIDNTDPLNPIVEIDAASTTQSGAVQLNDTVTSTSTTEAATANAVKTAYDKADNAIPDSTFTAAGELIVGTGAGAYTVLAPGAAEYILQSNGDGTLSWIVNSAGDVTSVSGTAPIQVDNTDPQTPVVSIDSSTPTAKGALLGCTDASNAALGCNAFLTGTGADNVAVGKNSLTSTTTGYQNVAVGLSALCSVTDSLQNTAVGSTTLCSFITGGCANDAFGALALSSLTSGCYNAALGAYSLFCFTSGNFNTAVGHRSMTGATTGECNTALGYLSGKNITTGNQNVSIGFDATVADAAGNCQLAIGFAAGQNWLTGDNTKAIKPGAGIIDCADSCGTAGQFLSSTGTALAWVTGVGGFIGTAPIQVDNTDPQTPVVSVDAATTSALGVVQVGTNIDVTAGTISVPAATTTDQGAVQVGTNIDVTAGTISVANSSTSGKGVVQLNNSTNNSSTDLALTAAQGKALQDQIDALALTSNITLAGTYDASTGFMTTVTTTGIAAGFLVGAVPPDPDVTNVEYFIIVDVEGSVPPPFEVGGVAPYHIGDWFLSDGVVWTFLNLAFQAPAATTAVEGVVYLATDAEVQAGTDTSNKVVNPASLQAKVSDSTSTTDSFAIASSTAVKSAYDLANAAIPNSTFNAQGDIIVGTGNDTYGNLTVGTNGQILVVDDTEIFKVKWTDAAATGDAGVTGTAPITVDNTNPANPIIGVSAASTSAAGVVQLNDSVTSTSTTQAATPSAVNFVYDLVAVALPKSGGTMTGNIIFSTGTTVNFADITSASVAAADQLATVVDNSNGNLTIVDAFDAGEF